MTKPDILILRTVGTLNKKKTVVKLREGLLTALMQDNMQRVAAVLPAGGHLQQGVLQRRLLHEDRLLLSLQLYQRKFYPFSCKL